jgi:enamine deaminase RidA (YjgF/YER057c/UK114 family)
MLCPVQCDSVQNHMQWIARAYAAALKPLELDLRSAVLRRFFCSDIVNQAPALDAFSFANPARPDVPCAISRVGQAPVPPAKVALWAYHIQDAAGESNAVHAGSSLSLRRGPLTHHWTTGVTSTDRTAVAAQTRGVFERYEKFLAAGDMALKSNAIRTWLFVRNVDGNYGAMVAARREVFAEHDMTPETHFIASTGVEGTHSNVDVKVSMDAYAIAGLVPGQVTFLSAPEHLSPTYLYGVTFERGVSVDYRDRKHIFLSGTASIDRHGRIVHACDVSMQLDHTLENMQALLRHASATLDDIAMCIVYVRDPSDFELAASRMRARFPHIPMIVTLAPVCRPGWLIEVEAIAVIPIAKPELPIF